MHGEELAQRWRDAANAHDAEALGRLMTDDVVVTPPPALSWDGIRHGREEAVAYFRQTFERVPGYRQEHDEVHVDGEDVVVRGRHLGPDELELELSLWLTVRDGLVCRYRSAAAAVDALRVQDELPGPT